MPRHVFTAGDLAVLRPLLDMPVVQRVLAEAVPVKTFQPVDRHVEPVELAVDVRGRDTPDGVPLQEILAAARAVDPTVESLVVRGAQVFSVHASESPPAVRTRLADLLGDRDRLLALRRPPVPPAPAPVPGPNGDEVLRRALLDDATGDAEWLASFRRWAVSTLLAPDGPQ